VIAWTGVSADHGVFADLDFWLAQEPGFARVIMMGAGVAAGLVRPQYDWGSMGAVDGDTLAYLTLRPAAAGAPAVEIGVCGYGPGTAALLDRLTRRIAAWDSEMNGTGDHLWIEVRSTEAEPAPQALVRVHRRGSHIVVGRDRADAHAG
jgi:protein-L-isoaspartate(D-aspartate) O-methyltransferase